MRWRKRAVVKFTVVETACRAPAGEQEIQFAAVVGDGAATGLTAHYERLLSRAPVSLRIDGTLP
jgi:hypothetical protein